MIETDLPDLRDEQAALFPVRSDGNEIRGRGELNIDIEPVFQFGDRLKRAARLRIKLQVQVNCLLAKAKKECGAAAREIYVSRASCPGGQFLHKCLQLRRIQVSAHG